MPESRPHKTPHWRDWLVPLVDSWASAAYKNELSTRTALDNDAFYERFYGATTTPRDTPIRLRKLLATKVDKLLWKVHPEDEFAHVNDDLDLGDVFNWISREFDFSFNASDWGGRDSFRFDWFVHWIQKKRNGELVVRG
jgi:hypothetical protein